MGQRIRRNPPTTHSLTDTGYNPTLPNHEDIYDVLPGVKTGVVGAKATGSVTVATAPAADDTLTVGGKTYTFKVAAALATEITIIADTTLMAAAIAAKLNADVNSTLVKATPAANVVNLVSAARGVAGNSVALAKTGTHLTVSGANLTGGVAQSNKANVIKQFIN